MRYRIIFSCLIIFLLHLNACIKDKESDDSHLSQIEKLEKRIGQGDVSAYRHLGFYYLQGMHTSIDEKKAFTLFLEGAKQNDLPSQAIVSILYTMQLGTDKNCKEAAVWLKTVEASSQSLGALLHALRYEHGYCVGQNMNKSIRYLEKASHDFPYAQYLLGTYYESLFDESGKTARQARQYLERAEKGFIQQATGDNSFAYYMLGAIYFENMNRSRYAQKAFNAFSQAAALGDPLAKAMLGTCYYEGFFVKQDYAKAFELYKAASTHDVYYARKRLVEMYEIGLGTSANYAEAKRVERTITKNFIQRSSTKREVTAIYSSFLAN